MAAKRKINKILALLKVVMFILVAIGIVMVIRRLMVLTGVMPTNNKPGFSSFDQGFGKQSLITILHIVPGALFMISGPVQFMPRIRLRHIQFHRWSGRVFIIAAYTIGITSIVLSLIKRPIGGTNEAVASIFFSIFFLVCISLSLHCILKKQVLLHREWMIRAFSVGLAISTVRLITVLAFICFKVPPQNFLGTAFWMGFTLHAVVAEVWINYTRKPSHTWPNTLLFHDIKEKTFH
jgi:hypothetical protein